MSFDVAAKAEAQSKSRRITRVDFMFNLTRMSGAGALARKRNNREPETLPRVPIPCTTRLQSDSADRARFPESPASGTALRHLASPARPCRGAIVCSLFRERPQLCVPQELCPGPCRETADEHKAASSRSFRFRVYGALHNLRVGGHQRRALIVPREERSRRAVRQVLFQSSGSTD